MPKFQQGHVTLHYELDGAGVPLVYVMGFGAHSNDPLSTTLRRTVSEHYQVLAVDNRGAGQTIAPEGTPVSIEIMADDIAAVMTHHQLGPAHVFGISMGGTIAMMLALRHPEKVKSLIIAVSGAFLNASNRSLFMLHTSRKMRDMGIAREIINRNSAVFLLSEEIFENEDFMKMWVSAPEDPYQQQQLGFEQQLAAIQTGDIRDQLHTIHKPTWVVSSPDDLLVPPRFQDELVEKIPNAEIKRYPGGHIFMLLPMYSAQFLQDAYAFWRKHD